MRGLIILGLWLALQEAVGDLTYYFEDKGTCDACADEHAVDLDTLTPDDIEAALLVCATKATHVFHWDCGRCIDGVKRRPRGSHKYLEEIYSSVDCELSKTDSLVKTEEVSMDTCIKQGLDRYSFTTSLWPSADCSLSNIGCVIVKEQFEEQDCRAVDRINYKEFGDGSCYIAESETKPFRGQRASVIRSGVDPDEPHKPTQLEFEIYPNDDYLCDPDLSPSESQAPVALSDNYPAYYECVNRVDGETKSTKWSLKRCLVTATNEPGDDVKINEPTVTVGFSQTLLPRSASDLNKISVAKSGSSNEVKIVVTISGSSLKIKVKEKLERDTVYIIDIPSEALTHFNGDTIKFKTAPRDYVRWWIYFAGYVVVGLTTLFLCALRTLEYMEDGSSGNVNRLKESLNASQGEADLAAGGGTAG